MTKNMTAKVAKAASRLCVTEFLFFYRLPTKTLGSLGKIRVGRKTGNTHIFFLALFGVLNPQFQD